LLDGETGGADVGQLLFEFGRGGDGFTGHAA
jgi:hypothetical protein